MELGYYFAEDSKTNEQISGVLPDTVALQTLVNFIKTHNKQYIDCGIIWVDQVLVNNLPNGNISVEYSEGDWAVWCNYDGEPIDSDNADISGNWEYAIDTIREAILN